MKILRTRMPESLSHLFPAELLLAVTPCAEFPFWTLFLDLLRYLVVVDLSYDPPVLVILATLLTLKTELYIAGGVGSIFATADALDFTMGGLSIIVSTSSF